VFAHVKYPGPVPVAGCDIFELSEPGQIRAHWNVRQPIGGNPDHVEERFADAAGLPPRSEWPRDALKARIRTMLEELWAKGDASLVPKYYSPAYIQHNPDMPGGFKRIQEVVANDIRAYIQSAGTSFPIEVHRIGAQGDLAFVHLSLFMAGINRNEGDTSTNVDIFRVDEAGLMIEHWDVLQMAGEKLPAASSVF
jgi:predicted SnoaL-like aldol condensation-catalyzing enzyme